jgi:hypothetical protein
MLYIYNPWIKKKYNPWNFQLVEALCQNKSHGFQLLRMPRKFAAWWMWPCPIPQCKTCPRLKTETI